MPKVDLKGYLPQQLLGKLLTNSAFPVKISRNKINFANKLWCKDITVNSNR